VAPYPQPTACSDDFAASRARLTAMIARLGGAEMMACTQEVLEDYLTATGRGGAVTLAAGCGMIFRWVVSGGVRRCCRTRVIVIRRR